MQIRTNIRSIKKCRGYLNFSYFSSFRLVLNNNGISSAIVAFIFNNSLPFSGSFWTAEKVPFLFNLSSNSSMAKSSYGLVSNRVCGMITDVEGAVTHIQ